MAAADIRTPAAHPCTRTARSPKHAHLQRADGVDLRHNHAGTGGLQEGGEVGQGGLLASLAKLGGGSHTAAELCCKYRMHALLRCCCLALLPQPSSRPPPGPAPLLTFMAEAQPLPTSP